FTGSSRSKVLTFRSASDPKLPHDICRYYGSFMIIKLPVARIRIRATIRPLRLLGQRVTGGRYGLVTGHLATILAAAHQ
ncbi:MAG TPA: hypothetical protein PLQ71_20620, partial [Nitrospira sp.]|nr:hypothetical protein [Nitrospira sp.]